MKTIPAQSVFLILSLLFMSLAVVSRASDCADYIDTVKNLSLPDKSGERLIDAKLSERLLKAIRIPQPTAFSRRVGELTRKDRLSPDDLKSLWYPKENCPSPVVAEYGALKRLLNTPSDPATGRRVLKLVLNYAKAGTERPGTLLEQMVYLELLKRSTASPLVKDGNTLRREVSDVIRDAKKGRDELRLSEVHEFPATPAEFDKIPGTRQLAMATQMKKELTLTENIRRKTRALAVRISLK